MEPGPTLDSIAHVVQISLTPVFLLSGVAALLNVFATRLARVADRVDELIQRERANQSKGPDDDLLLHNLRRRSTTLDWAVVLAALAGAMSCGAILVLFIGALRAASGLTAALLFALFGGAVVCTMGALAAFVLEMLIAGRGVRHVARRGVV